MYLEKKTNKQNIAVSISSQQLVRNPGRHATTSEYDTAT